MRQVLKILLVGFGISFLGACSQLLVEDGLLVGASDLKVPAMLEVPAGRGLRVKAQLPGYESTDVYHALYLPKEWRADRSYPLIVEYAGNGPFANKLGDVSSGKVESCRLGYGVSGGAEYIWLSLPFVDVGNGANADKWWGDVAATVAYCKAAVAMVCDQYGADAERIVLAGFSRGAIAANYIGLHDDEIASLWRGFICHSHYDGVKSWPYAGADRASALTRLGRLGGRPQFVSNEGDGLQRTIDYLQGTGVEGDFTFVRLPFLNHTADWVLKDLPERERLRQWLKGVITAPTGLGY